MPRSRLLLLAGAVGLAAIVVVVLIVVGSGGTKVAATTSTAAAAPTSTTSSQRGLFAGIPQHGTTIGRADTPATLEVYEDPQCPYCREWALGTLPAVLTDYVRPGKVKLVYHGIEIIGPNSLPGLRALYAAGQQGKLWNLADALYRRQGPENSGWITDAVIRDAARAAGANPAAVLAAAGTPAVATALRQAAAAATAANVGGTPTFVLLRPPGVPQQLQLSSLDPVSFESALSTALQ